MDPRSYKDIQVRSGHTYHTFVSPPANASQPTILFVHGFPSTANDWRNQVPFFVKAGYGVIAPDMIGYGETDKPTDPALYVSSKVGRDLVDILDAEGVEKAVFVGHDWFVLFTPLLYLGLYTYVFLTGAPSPSRALSTCIPNVSSRSRL